MTIDLDKLDQALYLVTLAEDNATVLCEAHRQAFEIMAQSLNIPFAVYELPDDAEDEPIVCQACHLANLKAPKIIVH